MMPLYSLALLLALALSAPVWGWRMARQGRYRQGLGQRLGNIPQRLHVYAQGHNIIWVHAVSVGEVLAAALLIQSLETTRPDLRIVLSTTTPTGQQVASERFGPDRVFFFPLDLAFAVRAYLRALQPVLLVLMESELWPRMLVECERLRIPVAVVNARVSDRSLPRYLALRTLWKPLLGKIRLLLAQSDEDAQRWIRIGTPAERVQSTGNLKYDVRIASETSLAALLRKYLPPEVPILLCGSTHPGEETPLLQCFQQLAKPTPVLVLAPRHPQRAPDIANLIAAHHLHPLQLSGWRLAPTRISPGDVLLVDTVGELAGLYALANIAFIGGSLVRAGGHNPLEPAQFGIPIVLGPHYENFRDIVEGMRTQNAVHIATQDQLCDTLTSLLSNNSAQAEQNRGIGQRAKAFFAQQSGATERTTHALLALLSTEANR